MYVVHKHFSVSSIALKLCLNVYLNGIKREFPV